MTPAATVAAVREALRHDREPHAAPQRMAAQVDREVDRYIAERATPPLSLFSPPSADP